MADRQSMTTQELVRRTLLDEHGDFLREAVAMVAAQLMEAEITARDRRRARRGVRRAGDAPQRLSAARVGDAGG